MERNSVKEMPAQAINTVLAGKLAMDLIQFGEKQHDTDGAQINRFVTCVLASGNPAANSGLFSVMTGLIRSLAAKGNVDGADGEAVQACRKICDVMGWVPAEAA